MAKNRHKSAAPVEQAPPPDALRGAEWLTQIALVLALAVVIARMTYSDNSRWRDLSMASDAPRVAGPAAAIGMDLLACVPAILVLARRVSDKQYILRWSWSMAPLLGLALWGAVSVAWSADKFTALLGATRFIGAAALLWAASQLVRSWARLRLVASIAAGLLLALFVHALIYRMLDAPQLKRHWNSYICRNTQHSEPHNSPGRCSVDGTELVQVRKLVLEQRGWQEGEFAAIQFEKKIYHGEAQGFFISPNTLAAVTVLLMVISFGLAMQRGRDHTHLAGLLLLGTIPLGAWIIWQAQSMTAAATPFLGGVILWAAWRFRKVLAAESKRIFWWGAGALAAGAAALVAHGLFHGTLFHVSLTFRWYYWTGAVRVWLKHAIGGVGWDNFGLHYLSARLPIAAEEVKDPHNVLVKMLVELGLVGAMLCIAWLGRVAWELTRPVTPPAPVETLDAARKPGPGVIALIASACAAGMVLNIIASVDFSQELAYVAEEIIRRLCLLGLMLIGATVGAVRDLTGKEIDQRPAPWVLHGMLAALAVFLVHNLIDFSLFESGPMLLFALVAGAALGVRQPSVAGQRRKTPAAAVALGASCVGWLAAAAFVWGPTVSAESAVDRAVAALRNQKPTVAARLYCDAREYMWLEADYSYRAARCVMDARRTYDDWAEHLLNSAIAGNPMAGDYRATRARYLLETRPGPSSKIIKDDWARIVELDPNSTALRVEYGDALIKLGDRADLAAAVAQYEAALRNNAALKPDEIRKRNEAWIKQVQQKIAAAKQR